jgi:hypothetical protein
MAGSANSAAKPTATHPSTSALITAWHPGEAARRMNMIIVIVITILLLYITIILLSSSACGRRKITCTSVPFLVCAQGGTGKNQVSQQK